MTPTRKIGLNILFLLISFKAYSQCSMTVTSSSGYEVDIMINVTGVSAPSSCPWGYNFNLEFDYDIDFIGAGSPGSLYTLQGNFNCDDYPNVFFNLPNSPGSGSGITTSNPYRSATDCATITPADLGCNTIALEIQGPGISHQTIDCVLGTPLPVTLLSFHATPQKNTIELEWFTVTEINNSHFNVEHSTDGVNWTAIATRQGAGNSSELIRYNARHIPGQSGTHYYRLKQVDFDGAFEYSPVRSATLTQTDTYTVYPNPTTDLIYISGPTVKANDLTLTDASGKELNIPFIGQENGKINDNTVQLDTRELSKGVYFIVLKDETIKFVKI